MTLGYLSALAARGHQVYWFTYMFPGAASSEEIEGVRVVRGGGMGSSILRARSWCRAQEKFDLVMDQHHGIPWYAPWWCGTGCVAYIHEVLGPIWSSFYPWPLSAIGRWQERWTHYLYRRVQFWTANESTRDQLKRHGVEKVKIIRYGVHTSALPELEPKPLQQPVRLIAVSRLAPNKRVDHAIRALKILLEKGISSSLRIVGSGECEPALRALVSEMGLGRSVELTGPVSEAQKDDFMRQAHYLVHTSQREGWGLNVIEANAMGTPAVVYPVEGLIESTLHRETGLVAAWQTPASLAETIEQSLASAADYQLYRQKAWERAKTFHWSHILPPACDWLEKMGRGEKES